MYPLHGGIGVYSLHGGIGVYRLIYHTTVFVWNRNELYIIARDYFFGRFYHLRPIRGLARSLFTFDIKLRSHWFYFVRLFDRLCLIRGFARSPWFYFVRLFDRLCSIRGFEWGLCFYFFLKLVDLSHFRVLERDVCFYSFSIPLPMGPLRRLARSIRFSVRFNTRFLFWSLGHRCRL